MDKKIENKQAALVTGGTTGIGRAVALALAGQGYRVIVNGRRPEPEVSELVGSLDETAGGGCRYVRGDIGRAEVRELLARVVQEEYPGISVLVNNAGITTKDRKDMLDLTEADMIELLRVNLIAPFLLSAALAPFMAGRHDPSYIINISSISAYATSTNRADYCLSKAGMSMMTRLFADRLAADNVRVFEVRPGIIRTDMTRPVAQKYDRLIAGGLLPIARWGEPGDVARTVVGIVLGYHPYSTGAVVEVDGGFHIRRLS